MRALVRTSIAIAALSLLLTGPTRAADWDLWPEASVPGDAWCCLSTDRDVSGVITTAESPDNVFFVGIDQTWEKDGQLYRGIQAFRDYELAATVPADRYIKGPWGFMYPTGTVDVMAYVAAGVNLVSMEIDGQVIPVDTSMLLHREPPGLDVAVYTIFPRFLTLGPHTLILTYQPQELFYYVEPYTAQELEDPYPEFEGRRVLVPEQVGNPVDGQIVLRYSLTVVPDDTAVEPCSWARVKAALQE